MNIQQNRYLFGKDFTLSRITIDGYVFEGCPYILEDVVREIPGVPVDQWKIKSVTAIPVGQYQVVIDESMRFKKKMIRLLNVPSFEGIRVHSGNTSHDTDGCLITGKERDERHGEVSGSRVALSALFLRVEAALYRLEPVTWTICGAT